MSNKIRLITLLVFIPIFFSTIFCNSRIGFSRPGTFMRTPGDTAGSAYNNFLISVNTEIINYSNFNYSRSINFTSTTEGKFTYGLSYLTHAANNIIDISPPSEFLFHFSKGIYKFNNLVINLGVHDIPIASDRDDAKPSLFLAFINKNIKIGDKYLIQSVIGFGTEKINYDSHNTAAEQDNNANLFCGFRVQTPWKSKKGDNGINLMIEYIDKGYHLGFDMPINNNIKFQFGITHLENFKTMNEYNTAAAEEEQIFGDDAGIVIGFEYQIPTQNNQKTLSQQDLEKVSIMEPENNCYIGLVKGNTISPLQINQGCSVSAVKQIVQEINGSLQSLQDSLLFLNQSLTAYNLTNDALSIKVNYLEDSLKTQDIKYYISKTELNIAIKSLTNSLKYYYSNEYHLALKELDKTIKYLPNLAAAYARRGSIYYKLGDLDRATINWNYALQLDPEYEDVKNILLKTKNKTIGKNNILPE